MLARLAAVALTALLGLSCGKGQSPVTSTSPPPVPSPTPPSGGGLTASSCRLGQGDVTAECTSESRAPRLLASVETAIDLLVREKPQLLDRTREARPNTDTFFVLDVEAYLDAIVTNLQRQGLCAQRDPDDFQSRRILAKDTNESSEGFSVVSEQGFIRRGGEAFRQTCEPASFPVDRTEDMPPAGSGCGRPYPPPIHHFNAKVHLPGFDYVTLDSTAIVGPDVLYCASIGYANRAYCPVRMEGSPDRQACEAWRIGRAQDSGRPGPTWTLAGHYCTGPASGCENHPDNQHGLFAYANGTYVMCAENGACGSVEVAR